MSWDPVQEESVSPLTPQVRRPSQIPRKPVGNRHASLEVAHVANHYGANLADEGVSPVSRLSSAIQSPADRVRSSYFSPDSIQFSRHVPSALGTSPIPFLDLDANETEMQPEQLTDYSNRGSSVHPEGMVRQRRATSSVYSVQGIAAIAFPFFGISAEEAAYLASSAATSEAGSLHLGLEQSIVEARQQHEILQAGLEGLFQDQIMREATVEQRIDQAMFEPPGLNLNNTGSARNSGGGIKWLPVSLQWWFISFLFLLSLGLGLAALLLTLNSQDQQGLGAEKSTSAFLFTYKFLPTLLAIIYTILVMAMLGDIKRTEPYARLSRSAGAPASTLFLQPGSLWSDPATALSKSANGGVRNWPLFWAAFVNLLSLLVVVPFSAAFMYPADVALLNSSNFSRLAVSADSPLKLSTDDTILFRTISGELLNTTTSAWVSSGYTILPFWPTNENTVPLGGVLSSSTQEWTVNTTVYQVDLQCNLMSLHSFANFTLPTTISSSTNLLSFVIESEDGCSLGLAGFSPDFGQSTLFSTGGGWWSEAPDFDYPLLWAPTNGTAADLNASNQILLNTTSQCGTRSIFFLAEPYVQNQTFKALGQVCTSSYFSATLPVTVSNDESPPSVTFDEREFEIAKGPIGSNVLDISAFENSFFSQNWATKFQSPNSSLNPDLPIRPKLGGPLSLLGAENNFNLSQMLTSPNLVAQARQVKQRFFGESMISNFRQVGVQNSDSISGTTATTERRILVSFVVGIMLAVAMLLSTCMLLLVAFHTRLDRRPLNLLHDPGSLSVMTSLISSRPDMRSLFEGTDRASEYAIRHKLSGYVLYLRNGELHAYDMSDVSQLSSECPELWSHGNKINPFLAGVYSDAASLETNNWCPRVLQDRILQIFLASIIIIALILAVLFGVFHGKAISHSVLIPGSNLEYTDEVVVALAPYSVIPTFICLGIMLFWASMVKTLRTLQPYISMTKKTSLSPRNPPSFINFSLLWTIGSAAWNREFLLSLVAVCGILSQVLLVTVTISGLWERNPAFKTQNITVLRTAELRSVPAIFTVVSPPTPEDETKISEGVLSNIFENSLTSWMFSSVNEGVYNSTPPPWTSEDWAFSPFNLTSVLAASDRTIQNSTSSFRPATKNVTVQTPSLRGRLECVPIDMSNTSAWLTTVNLTDKATWNGRNLTDNLTVGYEINNFVVKDSIESARPLFNISVAGYQMPSSESGMNTSEETAIGYWTYSADDLHTSIVIQWITGHPIPYQLQSSISQPPQTHWIWADIPKITALKCLPVFESANAKVDVDLATSAVQSYAIMNEPSPDLNAWSSRYQALNVSTGVPYSTTAGIGSGFQTKPGVFLQNVSVSYGYLFHDAILGAANAARIGLIPQTPPITERSPAIAETLPPTADNITDRTFIFRLPHLSADFMSYTSLALSGHNKSVLLDPATLGNVSSTVFSIFFKNFVQTKVSANGALFMDGAWGLQPLGATVPSDLGLIVDSNPPMSLQNSLPRSNANSSSAALLITKVENLDINHAAAIICLCILSIFIVAIVVIMVYRGYYLQDLPRDVDTVGSVLGLVYGSDRLLKLVAEDAGNTEQSVQRKMLKLGWFEVGQKRRWGVEVVYPGDRFLKEFLGADRGFKEIRLSD